MKKEIEKGTFVNGIFRPKTRGELVEKLKEGIECEVEASNEEITTICLKGWLNFHSFEVAFCRDKKWVIYKPI